MSLYKYTTLNTALKIIRESIRFTQPSAFNDPFEMVPELYVPEKYGEKDIKISYCLTSPRRNPPAGELNVDFESDHCNDTNSRKILKELNKKAGMLCLSKNPSSLTMWAHYADEYAGCMIEFDDAHEFFNGKFEIEYREYRPKKTLAHMFLWKILFQLLNCALNQLSGAMSRKFE